MSAWEWGKEITFRIVERERLPDGRWRVKFIFPDGSSARRYIPAHRYTDANLELVGKALATNPDLRQYR